MKVLGLVVEYNPFHNGHLYHLQKSKETVQADLTAAVMSGPFLQRGEPALVSKWERTKMALRGGVDLVAELPYAFAVQKAETFASGAVSILDALGCTDLCFGSEEGDIEPFLYTEHLINQKREQYEAQIHSSMQTGSSYPQALSLAFKLISENGAPAADLSQPNNILGYHYIKAIHDQHAAITPATIKRISAGYHEENLPEGSIASATGIRKFLFQSGNRDTIKPYVPQSTFALLDSAADPLKNWENFFHLLKYTLLTMEKEELGAIYEIEEGIENRILSIIQEAASFHDFMEKLKTKRYTWTRLQRMCVHILTRSTKKSMLAFEGKSRYVRILGMSQKGQQYLNQYKKKMKLPLISKVSSFDDPMLSLDLKAGRVYNMIYPEPVRSMKLREEYATPPLRYHEDTKEML